MVFTSCNREHVIDGVKSFMHRNWKIQITKYAWADVQPLLSDNVPYPYPKFQVSDMDNFIHLEESHVKYMQTNKDQISLW